MSSSRTDVRSTLPKWGITFQVPATILCSSVIKYMTTAHDQFVAPQERAIGAGFAAQGRTELSLQRAALDSASAARRRCSSDHGDGRLRPHHQNPNAQRGQVDPNPKHSNRQKRIPNKSPPKKKGSFFSVHRLSAFARSINTLLHAAYYQLIRANINSRGGTGQYPNPKL